jgi:hypothetical protein
MAASLELSLGQMRFHKPRIAFFVSTILVASGALRLQNEKASKHIVYGGLFGGYGLQWP